MSCFPFLSSKKSSRPLEVCFCLKTSEVVLGTTKDVFSSFAVMLLFVATDLVIVERCTLLAGPLNVSNVLWFSIVAAVGTNSFPVSRKVIHKTVKQKWKLPTRIEGQQWFGKLLINIRRYGIVELW